MERPKISPYVTLSHNLEGQRLEIHVQLPDVDEKNISLDMKRDSFCIATPKDGSEYSGCFLLDHEVETDKTETKYEDGVFRIVAPSKDLGFWDSLREGYMGRPVVKG